MDDKAHIFYVLQIGRQVTSKLIGTCSDGHRSDIFTTFIKKAIKIIILTVYDMRAQKLRRRGQIKT